MGKRAADGVTRSGEGVERHSKRSSGWRWRWKGERRSRRSSEWRLRGAWRRRRRGRRKRLLRTRRLQRLRRQGLRRRAGRLLEFADVGPLSQLKPRSSVRRCLMPRRDVDSCVGEVPSESMTEVKLRPTSRARMIHPGREKLPRQPLEVHSVDMTFPAQSALRKAGVRRLEA